MCWHEWDDWGCRGRHHHPGYRGPKSYGCYGPRWRYYGESSLEEGREDLEDEKRALESRLKELEVRLAEASK